MKFRTRLLRGGKTATGMEVPPKVVDALDAGRRPKVAVIINGYTYRSSIAVMNGKFMIGVSAEVREKAGVAGGDEVDVELALDTAPRVVSVPPELRKALDRNPRAGRAFEGLSYSRQQRYTLPIEKGKTAETRQRNVDKAIAELLKS